MTKKTDLVAIPTKEVAEKLNLAIAEVTGSQGMAGFQKAYLLAEGIENLKALLTPEYMVPIMQMQGNRLGFKTDKDKTGGYLADVVKNCLIEAVLMGLQPYGNQFNIIAGNMYMTKEGAGYLLNNFKGLNYDLVCGLPRMSQDGTSAAVEVSINWELNGEKKSKVVPIPIKVNAMMGVDAIIGKATRKGRAWLLSTITGIEVCDGEIDDHGSANIISSKINQIKKSDQEIEDERTKLLIDDSKTIEELDFYLSTVSEAMRPYFDTKRGLLLKEKHGQ